MIDQPTALLLGIGEMCDEAVGIREFEVIRRELPLGTAEHLTVGDAVGARRTVIVEIEEALDTLNEHRQSLDAIGEFGRYRVAIDPANLLEVGELADLHAIKPDLPTEPPRPQSGALPVIFDKADIVQRGVDADCREAREVEFLAVRRRRFEDHLKLIELLHSHGVFAVTPVRWP